MKAETFEHKLEESKKILNQLMDPAITLEESLRFYEDGLKHIKAAQIMIEEAKTKIKIIEKNGSK